MVNRLQIVQLYLVQIEAGQVVDDPESFGSIAVAHIKFFCSRMVTIEVLTRGLQNIKQRNVYRRTRQFIGGDATTFFARNKPDDSPHFQLFQ